MKSEFGGSGPHPAFSFQSITYGVLSSYPLLVPHILPRLISSSVPFCPACFVGASWLSSISSPNKKALDFSRLVIEPLNGLLPDARNGAEPFEDDDFDVDVDDASGSNINANDDWANFDRVGIGARGRSGTARLPVSLLVDVCGGADTGVSARLANSLDTLGLLSSSVGAATSRWDPF